MNYKSIQKAYKKMYGYTHTGLPFSLSSQGEKINADLENFFIENSIHASMPVENDAYNERTYLGVLYEYLQDLLEDLEDLDDHDFVLHQEEYKAVNAILNLIIATLAHDPE